MWAHSMIFIFISCTCCTAFVGAGEICDQVYENPKWEPDETIPVGIIRIGEDKEETIDGAKKNLMVAVENVTENFDLYLLARPFETNNCTPATSKYEELHMFHKYYPVDMYNDASKLINFGEVFTGCYYVEIKNAEGKKWIAMPCFYEGKSRFCNTTTTTLKCDWLDFKYSDIQNPHKLALVLQVPLTCFKLNCELFELEETDNNTIDNLNAGKILAKQTCSVTREPINKILQVECKRADTKLNLIALPGNETSDRWATTIEWKNLKSAGVKYYSKYEIDFESCITSYADILTWRPLVKFGAIRHDRNGSNILVPKPRTFLSEAYSIILFVILGFTVLAILIYWVTRYVRIMLDKKRRSNNFFVKPQETTQLYHLNESDEILLIYARESPEFMKTMDALRERLRKICHFTVRDVYAINEWSLVAELGPTRWVEDRLREGSKVVWVDTPQFRSVVANNKSERHAQNQYDAIDFRDEAIPYAVTLATHLFQNAATQYRQHFVIRLEGLEVEDGSDDPLLVVSPHARYCIPEHLDLLDKHLAR